jgi:hypothetical protein
VTFSTEIVEPYMSYVGPGEYPFVVDAAQQPGLLAYAASRIWIVTTDTIVGQRADSDGFGGDGDDGDDVKQLVGVR